MKPRINAGEIAAVKSRRTLAEIVGRYADGERRVGGRRFWLCPFHNERTPSFTVTPDGRGFVCFGCGAKGDVLDFVMQVERLDLKGAIAFLAGDAAPTTPTGRCMPMSARPQQGGERNNRLTALEMWAGARPIASTLGERYLRARGIEINLPPSLRFADALLHAPTGLRLPALIAAIAGPDCKITAVTRIYLRADGSGKAGVSPPKMTLGPMANGAVRLAPAGDILGLSEGVEWAASAMQLYGQPVWATLGAGRLANVAVPETVRRLVIFGDRGEAGEAAAERAQQAHVRPGRVVQVVYPATGGDFNDDLQAEIKRGAA
jgi:DNA primase